MLERRWLIYTKHLATLKIACVILGSGETGVAELSLLPLLLFFEKNHPFRNFASFISSKFSRNLLHDEKVSDTGKYERNVELFDRVEYKLRI